MTKQERRKMAQRLDKAVSLHPQFEGLTVNEIFTQLIKKGELTTGAKSVPQKVSKD